MKENFQKTFKTRKTRNKHFERKNNHEKTLLNKKDDMREDIFSIVQHSLFSIIVKLYFKNNEIVNYSPVVFD